MGAKFDPNQHDGIYQFDDPTKPPGTVAAVMKPGYMLHDRVLRPATVATVKGVYVAPATETTPAANGSPSGAQS
jgi:molecular chaperone GrpE